MSTTVELSHPADGVALVVMNRPERRNALNRDLLQRLVGVFEDIGRSAAAGEIRAVVLTGAGTAFCAGLDLGEVSELGLPDIHEYDVCAAVRGAGVPVVGAINGPAVTGGLELALSCDLRVASASARFADTHARIGVVPGWGLTGKLPLAVGQGWARQMSFTGNYVDARLAERIGLVNSVVPDDELLPYALGLAGDMATTETGVLATVRSLYDDAAARGAGAAWAREREIWEARDALADKEGVAARREDVIRRGRRQISARD
ncbi:enoyl-CoA hydratase [Streptomyces sp. SID4956]|uniref:enoyl-CoA hydratase n=1 Tax=Streptomyces sp. SID4956 TaxID=2690290 RepID=UPI001370D4F4|nr:enoyl-CoA hydratase [Streptomyces sp. SID4956]